MKVKLDENLPARLVPLFSRFGYDVDTVADEGLSGAADSEVWARVRAESRFFVTQDMDFSDLRLFAPGTHAGILLVRLREPGAKVLAEAVTSIVHLVKDWGGCFVILTEHKLRVIQPHDH